MRKLKKNYVKTIKFSNYLGKNQLNLDKNLLKIKKNFTKFYKILQLKTNFRLNFYKITVK